MKIWHLCSTIANPQHILNFENVYKIIAWGRCMHITKIHVKRIKLYILTHWHFSMTLLIFTPNILYKTNFFCQTPLCTSYGVIRFHDFIYLLAFVNKTHRHIIDTRQWICSNFSTFQMTPYQQFPRKNLSILNISSLKHLIRQLCFCKILPHLSQWEISKEG